MNLHTNMENKNNAINDTHDAHEFNNKIKDYEDAFINNYLDVISCIIATFKFEFD